MLKKSDYAVLLYGKKMFSLVNLYTIALTNKKMLSNEKRLFKYFYVKFKLLLNLNRFLILHYARNVLSSHEINTNYYETYIFLSILLGCSNYNECAESGCSEKILRQMP